MKLIVLGSVLVTAFGFIELALAIRHKGLPKYMGAQGLFFVEFGLAMLFLAVLPRGVLRTVVGGSLLFGSLWSLFIQIRLLWAHWHARRDDTRKNAPA